MHPPEQVTFRDAEHLASGSHAWLSWFLTVLVFAGLCSPSLALNNGLARTPPMGWNAYNAGMCGMREQQWRTVAYAMSVNGMKEAGYLYCNTDCGINGANVRAADGSYTWSTSMFPSGIPTVWEYIHSLGLKAGLYIFPPHQSHGPGNQNIENDAKTFASWGCDYLKYDGWSGTDATCFPRMRDALLATGRPIVYNVNGAQGGSICNSWRNSGDIDYRWEYWINNLYAQVNGGGSPGSWPDPDMLETGNMRNKEHEEMLQFSVWCVTSAQLLAGNDVRTMFDVTRYILLNTEAIAVNQDTAFSTNSSYGGSGKRIKSTGGLDVWVKTLSGGAKAVVLANMTTAEATITVNWTDIGLGAGVAHVRDLWEHANVGFFTNSYTTKVRGHGCAFVKIVAGSNPVREPVRTWAPKPNDPTPVSPISRTGWTVSPGTLPYPGSGEGAKMLDGDLSTTVLGFSPCNPPEWFSVDMKTPQTFNCVIMSGPNDSVGPFLKPYTVFKSHNLWELFVSDNGTTWQGPVDSTWSGPHDYKAFTFTTRTARYLKINHSVVGSSEDNKVYGYCKNGLGELYVANVGAVAVNGAPGAAKAVRLGAARPRLSVMVGSDDRLPATSNVYSVDGRRMVGATGSVHGARRAGLVVVREEISAAKDAK